MSIIEATVYYVVVPILYILILVFDVQLIRGARGSAQRVGMVVGAAGGVLLSIILIVLDSATNIFQRSNMPDPTEIGEVWPFVLFGFIAGLIMLSVIDLLLRSGVTSFIVLFTIGATFTSAYFLLTVSEVRSIVAVTTIAFIVGNAIYIMVRPEQITAVFTLALETEPEEEESEW